MTSPRTGRPRKSPELHVLAGTFREDRHGPRPDALGPSRPLVKPPGLDDEGGHLWDFLTKELAASLRPTDASELELLCDLWSLSRKSLALVRDDPTDVDARIAFTNYTSLFDKIAGRFGLSPSDRARLHVATEPEKPGIAKRKRN